MNQSAKLTSSIELRYTAPGEGELGQQQLSLSLAGPPVALLAVCGTEIVVTHPPGQTLRLRSAQVRTIETSEALVVLLPEDEVEFVLGLVEETSAAEAEILVKTKKERSKPERPLRAAFE